MQYKWVVSGREERPAILAFAPLLEPLSESLLLTVDLFVEKPPIFFCTTTTSLNDLLYHYL